MQLTIAINFVSPKDIDGKHEMNSNRNNTEIKICDKGDEVIEQLFKNLLIDIKLV